MRKYKKIKVESNELVEWKCSVCGRDLLDDMEGQEAFCFDQIGGYASVFGDGAEISIDICQHCMKEKFGEYIDYV